MPNWPEILCVLLWHYSAWLVQSDWTQNLDWKLTYKKSTADISPLCRCSWCRQTLTLDAVGYESEHTPQQSTWPDLRQMSVRRRREDKKRSASWSLRTHKREEGRGSGWGQFNGVLTIKAIEVKNVSTSVFLMFTQLSMPRKTRLIAVHFDPGGGINSGRARTNGAIRHHLQGKAKVDTLKAILIFQC